MGVKEPPYSSVSGDAAAPKAAAVRAAASWTSHDTPVI